MRAGSRARGWHVAGVVVLTLSFLSVFHPARASERYASLVIEADTGRVLHQVNADEPRYPASLTKMMTAYLTFEALAKGQLKLNQPLPVSRHAADMAPSKLGLQPGQTITVDDALLAIATKSANDAAVVLAEAIAGSEPDFARLMTQRAHQLGMTHTTFANAHGLPNLKQITTARDMATLAQALLRDHPRQYRYFSTAEFTFNGMTHRNHDHLLGRYEGVDGIKTGFTDRSGFNLVSSAVREGRRVIGVVFGGQSAKLRDQHMVELLDEGFRSIEVRTANASRPAKPKLDPQPVELQPAGESEAVVAAAAPAPVPSPSPKVKTRLVLGKASIVKTAPVAALDEGDGSDGPSWGVQVGAFKSTSQAKRAVAEARRHDPKLLAHAKADLSVARTPEGKLHRARLVGLTETQSRSACRVLKQKSQHCVPVTPSGQLASATQRTS